MRTDWFWRWYDRAHRLDFAWNMLAHIFDLRLLLPGLVGGGGTFLWAAIEGRSPLDVWIVAVLVAAALAVLASFILKLWDRRRNPIPISDGEPADNPTYTIVPLYEAARRAYDECKNTRGGKIAKGINNSPEEIISYYAYALAEKIPIYGIPPLSRYAEKVPLKLGSSALRIEFRGKIAFAVSAFSDGLENSENLFVHESDLEDAIKSIRTIM